MDSLEIKRLKVNARIGVHEWEKRIIQPLYCDISIPISFNDLNDDNLGSVLDYALLCQKVTAFVESTQYQLLETLANQLAIFIKNTFGLTKVTVSISKPHAVENAGDIQITVHR